MDHLGATVNGQLDCSGRLWQIVCHKTHELSTLALVPL